MPELPEVETVKETLKKQVLGKKVKNVHIYYKNIISAPQSDLFIKNLIGEKINDVKRRGKWLMFELDHYFLLSHLRMEGKYFLRDIKSAPLPHEHVSLIFTDDTTLRYVDTRKFGRMYLLEKENIEKRKPLCELGKEPFDVSFEKNK